MSGDGCSDTCTFEDGYECVLENKLSVCTLAIECGNSVKQGDEECDAPGFVECTKDCTVANNFFLPFVPGQYGTYCTKNAGAISLRDVLSVEAQTNF